MINITPKRRELLQAIDEGWVSHKVSTLGEHYDVRDRGPSAEWPPGRYLRVTAAASRFAAAGLIEPGPTDEDDPYRRSHLWALTDSGRIALTGSPSVA